MTKAKKSPAPEETYPFDYEDMQRRAREAIARFSSLEPSRDANGNVIVHGLELVRRLSLNIAQRMLELPPPPPGPIELGPGETEVSVRRKIRRLRALKTEVDDPIDGARIEAEKLETRAYLRREFLGIGYDLTTAMVIRTGEARLAAGGVLKERFAQFNAVKQLPEAHDPANPLSAAVRAMHRLRKAMHGRPQKRKGKERKRRRR